MVSFWSFLVLLVGVHILKWQLAVRKADKSASKADKIPVKFADTGAQAQAEQGEDAKQQGEGKRGEGEPVKESSV